MGFLLAPFVLICSLLVCLMRECKTCYLLKEENLLNVSCLAVSLNYDVLHKYDQHPD